MWISRDIHGGHLVDTNTLPCMDRAYTGKYNLNMSDSE